MAMPVVDDDTRELFKTTQELGHKIMSARWEHYVDQIFSQYKFLPVDLVEQYHKAKHDHEWMAPRVELMYSFGDYRYKRHEVRRKFIEEMHKKSTLEDIGESLDDIILDSKAKNGEYYVPKAHHFEVPEIASYNLGSRHFEWKGRLFDQLDEQKPAWFDDLAEMETAGQIERKGYRDIIDQVKFNDKQRDYSYEALTPDEHHEIALFHTMKQDPFYKHHLRTHLNKYAEHTSDQAMNGMSGNLKVDPNEFTKFDRINLFDIRRTLPMKERQAILDKGGRAWAIGKRKESFVICAVKAGSGKITCNGKPFHMYFHQAWQRNRVITPLVVTSYTALLDVEFKIRGGGTTGQADACVPALAKAIQGFDVRARKPLKFL
jgi:ribosomal protein S9